MTKPITRSQQCLGFCVTGAVLSQWPTLSTPDQFIDETLMNLPSARHRHLCLCLWLASFWKAVCDVTCLPPGKPVNLDRAVSHNTLYPLLLQRMSGPKILSPCENRVMMLGLFSGTIWPQQRSQLFHHGQSDIMRTAGTLITALNAAIHQRSRASGRCFLTLECYVLVLFQHAFFTIKF